MADTDDEADVAETRASVDFWLALMCAFAAAFERRSP
jgi:hypothetical protein